MKNKILIFLGVLCFLGCSLQRSLTSEINGLSGEDFYNLSYKKKKYIKDKRLEILKFIFQSKNELNGKYYIVENYRLFYTPYQVLTAIKLGDSITYLTTDDRTGQKLHDKTDTLKNVNYAIKYYSKLFGMAERGEFKAIQDLHMEKERKFMHGGEPSFLTILNFEDARSPYVEKVVPFTDFALLWEEMYPGYTRDGKPIEKDSLE